jgi:phosphoribosylamine-glycine ligase
VLGVTALARDLARARDLANLAASKIRFEGAFYRRDIGRSLGSTTGAEASPATRA